MKFQSIVYTRDCYVYSTSHRFCFPFTFAPFTTVGPLDGNMSKAISFMWKRGDRNFLVVLHEYVYSAAEEWGLERLYWLSVLAYALPSNLVPPSEKPRLGVFRSREALDMLAADAEHAGERFPLSGIIMDSLQSFAPTLQPSHEELQKARAVWTDWKSRGPVTRR